MKLEDKPQANFKFKAKKYTDYSEAKTEDLNLMNLGWIQVLILKSGKAATMYTSLKDHPLYKTHKVKFHKQEKNTVLNFVGGLLPRCD